MPFSPKQLAAIKLKDAKKQGNMPLAPIGPQTVASQISNLAPAPVVAPTPVANATMSAFKMPGAGVPPLPKIHAPGPIRKFGALRKKLGGL